MFPWATDIFKFSMYIQGPTFIIFATFSKPYVYSRPYVYSFCQIFQALRLFPALRLSRTLEYVMNPAYVTRWIGTNRAFFVRLHLTGKSSYVKLNLVKCVIFKYHYYVKMSSFIFGNMVHAQKDRIQDDK